MKCFLVRDLLPFYAEGKVSEETKELVEEHFLECEQCRELYESIVNFDFELNQDLKLEEEVSAERDKEFWRKYYANLYIKGIEIFLMAFIIIIFTFRIIKNIL